MTLQEKITSNHVIKRPVGLKRTFPRKILLDYIVYTRSRITRTRLYRIIAYFEGHLPHQKSLH